MLIVHYVKDMCASLIIAPPRINGSNIQKSWDNIEREIHTLAESGEVLADCSPIVADIKLLWAVISKAVLEASVVEEIDIGAVSAIVDRIEKLDLYKHIDGGKAARQAVVSALQRAL
jgi:hypothetical protein